MNESVVKIPPLPKGAGVGTRVVYNILAVLEEKISLIERQGMHYAGHSYT